MLQRLCRIWREGEKNKYTLAFFEALSTAMSWQFALFPILLCVFIGAAGENDGSKKQELKT